MKSPPRGLPAERNPRAPRWAGAARVLPSVLRCRLNCPRSGGIALVAEDVHYFTEQAHKCFRLARLCNDDAVAERLRELGAEFARRAIALGADPRLFPKLD